MNAWLLTWEGMSPRITADNKIAAIVSARRSSSFIYDLVDVLYHRSIDAVYQTVSNLYKPKLRRQLLATYSTSDRLFFGRDSLIFARLVNNLRVSLDRENGTETVSWTDPPYLRIENPGEMPHVADQARRCTLVRGIHAPLSGDVYRDLSFAACTSRRLVYKRVDRMSSPDYVWEKMYLAIDSLCRGGSLKKRLQNATIGGLFLLEESDLPPGELQDDLRFVLSWTKRNIKNGEIQRVPRGNETRQLARKMLNILMETCGSNIR